MKHNLRSAFNSRQHMLSKDFEVFYYSDTLFQSVGVHTHTYYEFYFFLEGEVTMELDGHRFPLKQGDLAVVPPGIRHRANVTDPARPYRRIVLWISASFAAELMSESPDYMYLLQRAVTSHEYVYHFDLIEYNEMRIRLFTLLDEIHRDRFGRSVRIGLLISDLLIQINRSVYEKQTPFSRGESPSMYESIVRFIDTHLEENLSLDRLASEFYLSKYYIAHLFQETTGLSIHQYITKKRLQLYLGIIRDGASVTEAYNRCGFGDYSSFYRAFKKEYGLSPAQYQQDMLLNESGSR
jgi:AraC-like DNA-binding protein